MSAPFVVQEVLQLPSTGVQPASINFNNVTMEADNFILVRETTPASSIVMVDLAHPTDVQRRNMSADSAIMHPTSKILALRAVAQDPTTNQTVTNLQVYNLETKAKLKAAVLADQVVYWKWVSPRMIGLVTATSVLHWEMDGDPAGAPVKVFDRAPNLAGTQIISYRVDPTGKWCTVIGIAPGPPEKPALIQGRMQLYSIERAQSQPLDAHCAAFSSVKLEGRDAPCTLIAFAQKSLVNGALVSKLHVIEVGGTPGAMHKRQSELFFPPEFADDVPIALLISERFKLVYVVTRLGLLFVYDLETATAVYRNRIATDAVFLAAPSGANGGLYVVTRPNGAVLRVSVNEAALVPFVSTQLKNVDLAVQLARRGNLPGAESSIQQQFDAAMAAGKYKEAAEVAAESPAGMLRTRDTMDKLRAIPPVAGQPSPLLAYFQVLLQRGTLNAFESVELAKLVIAGGKKHLLSAWVKENKLEASEPLGDLLMGSAQEYDLAMEVYRRGNVTHKVAQAMAAKGDFEGLVAYSKQQGYTPDYARMLQEMLTTNPAGAVNLAKRLGELRPPPMSIRAMAELFFSRQLVKEGTSFLLDALKEDKVEDAPLQTMLLELNISTNPPIADTILKTQQFTHYDRPRIAQRCENAGMYIHALSHYQELTDIKRVIVNTHAIEPSALIEYFGNLSPEWALECLRELIKSNGQGNLQLVVEIGRAYVEHLGVERIMNIFQEARSYQGMYLFLGSQIATSTDKNVVFKYIEAAAKTAQLAEVERVTRESEHYDAVRVKDLLTELKLPDARPLINVCDRFDSDEEPLVYEMTNYFWSNGMSRYIEGYVQKINPAKAPKVVAALLDADAPNDFTMNLIISVRSLIPVDAVVAEFEKRNRLRTLTKFLEYLVNENSTNPHVHSALAMNLIESNNNPEHFLTTNEHYEPLVVGKFAEKRDPTLACVAYRKGKCDDALIDCTNRNSLFKIQSKYVVDRHDTELWARVLSTENPHRKALVDQVVAHALPECKNPDHVSAAVRAFMAADIPNELIELLEKIVLHSSTFSQNENLQNLLIITAIKADSTRVMDYINRLDKFDGPAVGEISVGAGLFEEAFVIYKKFDHKVLAIKVLLDHMNNLERASEYAAKVDDVEVWSVLAEGQLERGMVKEAIECFMGAQDGSKFRQVIIKAKEAKLYDDLIKYLKMVRTSPKTQKEPLIDTELCYAFAKANRLADLEAFIATPTTANLQQVGDRLFDEASYDAARILFEKIPNFARLASTYVRLHRFQESVEAARKANSPRCWKEVCFACIEEKELRLAQLCALNIIVNADDLPDVVDFYKTKGHHEELISLLESGIGLERAHMGIFTELGILYAKYRPQEKLMEHIKLFSSKINIPRLISVCQAEGLWKALVALYAQYEEFDSALKVMMEHHKEAWDHATFKDVAVKVTNLDLYYKSAIFYLDEHPELINDLLKVLEARIDHARVIDLLRKRNKLPLIKEYLLNVQKLNLAAVNEAVNELAVLEEDPVALKMSIESYDNFDQLQLAGRLEKLALIEFRRMAGYLYKKAQKWRKAIELAKSDKQFKDAMEIASQSGQREIVDELLQYFIKEKNKESFAACLYTCYDLVRPDVALELAWQNQMMDVVMPYMIQVVRESTQKIDTLMEERAERMKKDQTAEVEKAKLEAMGLLPSAHMPLALPWSNEGAPAALVSTGPVLPPVLQPGGHAYAALPAPAGWQPNGGR